MASIFINIFNVNYGVLTTNCELTELVKNTISRRSVSQRFPFYGRFVPWSRVTTSRGMPIAWLYCLLSFDHRLKTNKKPLVQTFFYLFMGRVMSIFRTPSSSKNRGNNIHLCKLVQGSVEYLQNLSFGRLEYLNHRFLFPVGNVRTP